MKKWFSKLLCFIMLLLTFFAFAGCEPKKSEYEIARDRITNETEIEVPVASKIVYHSHDVDDPWTCLPVPGRKAMYTVFQFESEPTDWLNENSFVREQNDKFERSFPAVFDFLPVKEEDIPQEFLPNFEEVYYYFSTESHVYFVYIPQSYMLIVGIPGH